MKVAKPTLEKFSAGQERPLENTNCYNVQYSEPEETDGTTRSVGLGQIKDLQVILS